MKKVTYLFFTFLLIGSFTSCMSEEEMEKARKYKLDYIYVDEQIELKDIPYSKTFKFKAKETVEKSRFVVEFHYLNFKKLWRDTEEDIENRTSIYKSLIGFSYKVYDKTNNKIIFSYKVTDTRGLSISTATPSIYLGSNVQIKKNIDYEVVIDIPSKKDTKEQYLNPVFVVGVLRKAPL